MSRAYFYVNTYGQQWKVTGGAYAGPTVHHDREDALGLARQWAMNLHRAAQRPTGVRIQLDERDSEGNPQWADDSIFG